mgnify:CR=1 FL=1
MSSDIISIKGTSEGLLISVSPTEEWQAITSEIAARLDENLAFYAGGKVILDTGERPVPKYELSSLKALLERRSLSLMVVQSASQTTVESAESLDVRATMNAPTHNADTARYGDEDAPIDPEELGTEGVMIRRTLRSGRTVHSRGHVVIYGDVNAGAKVIASGDIIVWGRLRGMVHAGAEGDTNAIICALDMNPSQLRIAEYITTSPTGKRGNIRPEVALIRNQQIVVETWD